MSYRHETTSEESFLAAGMARAMSDLTINESGFSVSTYEESWAEGGGGASFDFLWIISIGGGGGGGSYDADSAAAFSRSLSRHAESASSYVAASVRAKSTTSIGEVNRRMHAEGESEAHYESASRMFRNPNKCKAVTFLFHKINKLQKIRFKRVAIERRVEDPSVPTGAYQRILPDTTGRVAILPQSILANSKNRIEIEQTARKSAAERWQASASAAGFAKSGFYPSAAMPESTLSAVRESVFSNKLHNDALAKVDKDLAAAGLLNLKTGKPDEKIVAELSWKREEITPTPGVLVKGCLDECNICEPTLQREIELDLERKQLENAMLKQQIELLEKSQEYRCCPGEASSGREDEDG